MERTSVLEKRTMKRKKAKHGVQSEYECFNTIMLVNVSNMNIMAVMFMHE